LEVVVVARSADRQFQPETNSFHPYAILFLPSYRFQGGLNKLQRLDRGASPRAASSCSACGVLARASGAITRVAAQVDNRPAHTAARPDSGSAERSCSRRLTQLSSRPQRRPISRCDTPRPCVSSRRSNASSIAAKGRLCVRAPAHPERLPLVN